MKTTRFTLAALLSGAILTLQAEKVRLEELPPELQTKIRTQVGSAAVNDIDRQLKNGQTVYEVGFKKDGQQTELQFNQQGDLLNRDASPVLDSRKITWNDVPEGVKRVAQSRLNGAVPDDIDRQVKDGKVTYEIGFKQAGQQKELLLSDDGRILRDTQLPQELIAGATPPPQSSAATRLTRAVTLTDTQKVPLNWAPEKVQLMITTNASGAAITDFQKGKWRGRTVYQASYQLNGQPVQFQVAEDGRVLYDPRNPTAVGTAAGSVIGRSQYSNTSPVSLSASQKMDRRSVPAAVERAIQAHAGNNPIEDIERGAWRGRNIYQVAFKDNGRHIELQVDENGNVVFDPRTANK